MENPQVRIGIVFSNPDKVVLKKTFVPQLHKETIDDIIEDIHQNFNRLNINIIVYFRLAKVSYQDFLTSFRNMLRVVCADGMSFGDLLFNSFLVLYDSGADLSEIIQTDFLYSDKGSLATLRL